MRGCPNKKNRNEDFEVTAKHHKRLNKQYEYILHPGTIRTSRSISVLFGKKVFPFGFIGTPLNAWLRGNMKHISLSQNDKPAERREPSHLHHQFTN